MRSVRTSTANGVEVLSKPGTASLFVLSRRVSADTVSALRLSAAPRKISVIQIHYGVSVPHKDYFDLDAIYPCVSNVLYKT